MTLPVVNIYTRRGARGNDAERIVTFRLPEWMDVFDLLKNGFALDGNQAAAAISYDREGAAFVGPFETVEPTLTAALNTAQRALVKYLRAQGYDPQFA